MTFPQIMAGGQTGAERAALDCAVANDIPHGGWCPKDRQAEDGRISDDYRLKQTTRSDFRECAEKNVSRSTATVIFTFSARLGKHSRLSAKLARKHQKPWLHIHRRTRLPGMMLVSLVSWNRVARLNVTGSTASEEPAVDGFVRQLLDQTFGLLLDRDL